MGTVHYEEGNSYFQVECICCLVDAS